MKRFVLGAAVGSARQMLAIVIAVLAIGGAGYLGSHPLSNPDHMDRWGTCSAPPQYHHTLYMYPRPCGPPSRFAWQIPVAVLLGLAGLGSAVVIAGNGRRPLHRLADGVSQRALSRI